MKKYIFFFCSICLAVFLANCEDEIRNVQYPIDNIPPKKVENVVVENLPGSVKLTYELPDEQDLLYIKALYPLSTGETGEIKTSVFSNKMHIKGFGKSKKHTIQLVSVDKSQNESEPVSVEIEPFDSPIYEIFNSLKVLTAFGGFTAKWENPLNENISLEISEIDTINQFHNFLDIIHSSQADASYSVRGMDTTYRKFSFFIKDLYENFTDTLEVGLKPYFEQQIPLSGIKALPIPPYFQLFGAGRDASLMFDGNQSTSMYIRAGNIYGYMPWFTVDMGLKAVYSRFILFHRNGYEWTLHNMREFEIWGTNSAETAAEHDRLPDEWKQDPNWIFLGDFKSVRPSGGTVGQTPTSEDMEYILTGDKFEFPLGIPAVRYLRWNVISTWSNSTGVQAPRAYLYGQIVN
ncbi:DUF4959 domain-containing protein [Gaoshiqia sp. Z1-71]|uniref:DUF4959 domain-containing protein n=1 Tax=Gaoshiqia hydrogeniformans TaxID=3290090 RepID=UPI003BF7C421